MISLKNVSLQRGHKILLEGASLEVFGGQKIGLIGANGSGKSSLFKLLLQELHIDAGDLNLPAQWRIAHMAQEVLDHSGNALNYVLDGDAHLRELEAEIAKLSEHPDSCGTRLAECYAEMEQLDGYTAAARAEQLLDGLGFAPGDGSKDVKDFSGGWRIRLNLARALMCPSELLLLDEPTNHLDLDATVWLETWLQRYPGTLLIISHDRDFLDAVIDRTVSVEGAKLISYTGNYSAYEKQRAERLAQQQQAFEKQQTRIAEIEGFVRRFKAKASKAKQAQSRVKELERMEQIAPAHVDSPFSFSIEASDKISTPLLSLNELEIGYPGKTILKNVDLSIQPSTRIGLLGANGAGKSTLVKLISGDLAPLAGARMAGEHLNIGYFAQHQLEALDLSASAALHIQRLSPTASEQEIRNYLGSFGFQGDRAFEIITHFSGGEKARLALALIAWQKPNVLLLDEPTNHLDLEVRHALTMALQGFEGAVILVSHDRHLLRNSVDEFLLVDDGKVEPFKGDLADYQKWLLELKKEQKQEQKAEARADLLAQKELTNKEQTAKTDAPQIDKKAQRQQAAEIRKLLQPLSKEVQKLEKSVEKLQSELDGIEEQLADSSLYEAENKNKLTPLLTRQGEVKSALDEAEEAWFEKSEELEEKKAELEG